jgi:hypothetical protein
MSDSRLERRLDRRQPDRLRFLKVCCVAAACLALLPLEAKAQHAPDGIEGGTPDWESAPVEIGARFGFLELQDTDSGLTLLMGGFGGYARLRLSRRLGVEASLDAYLADQLGRDAPGEVLSVAMPFAVSAMFYLFPESEFSVYLLGGVGVAAHAVRYEALGVEASWVTPVAQLGFGVQYRLDDMRFDLSIRSLAMNRSADAVEIVPLSEGGTGGASYRPRTDARNVIGGMLTLGVHWAL